MISLPLEWHWYNDDSDASEGTIMIAGADIVVAPRLEPPRAPRPCHCCASGTADGRHGIRLVATSCTQDASASEPEPRPGHSLLPYSDASEGAMLLTDSDNSCCLRHPKQGNSLCVPSTINDREHVPFGGRVRETERFMPRSYFRFGYCTVWLHRGTPHQRTTTELLFRRVAWMPAAEPITLRCRTFPSPPPGDRHSINRVARHATRDRDIISDST